VERWLHEELTMNAEVRDAIMEGVARIIAELGGEFRRQIDEALE
jgi:hypothetical protein